MARYAVLQVALFILAFVCLIQARDNIGTFRHDMIEDFVERLTATIKREHITCENYEKFCETSNNQFQSTQDHKDKSVNDMAIEFCKGILKPYVCNEV